MAGREAILARVRAATRHEQAHPGPYAGTSLPASFEAFGVALAAAGGEAHGPLSREALAPAVLARAREWAPEGRRVAQPSASRILAPGDFETAEAAARPHSFADVEVGVALGFLGVAENGAVAVLGRDAPQRALLMLPERLVLLLYAGRIVGDLHAGFRALPRDAIAAHHVTWIAGPSKSADIEQTVVLGAHGPRSLAVFAYTE